MALGLNMAVGTSGGVSFFATQPADLIVDITGCYIPIAGVAHAEIVASTSPSSNQMSVQIVVVIVVLAVVISALLAAVALFVQRHQAKQATDSFHSLLSDK